MYILFSTLLWLSHPPPPPTSRPHRSPKPSPPSSASAAVEVMAVRATAGPGLELRQGAGAHFCAQLAGSGDRGGGGYYPIVARSVCDGDGRSGINRIRRRLRLKRNGKMRDGGCGRGPAAVSWEVSGRGGGAEDGKNDGQRDSHDFNDNDNDNQKPK